MFRPLSREETERPDAVRDRDATISSLPGPELRKFSADGAVAFASLLRDGFSVQNPDAAALLANRSRSLQIGQAVADRRAAQAQQPGYRLMGDRKLALAKGC